MKNVWHIATVPAYQGFIGTVHFDLTTLRADLFALKLHLLHQAVPALLELLQVGVDLLDGLLVATHVRHDLPTVLVKLIKTLHLRVHVLLDRLQHKDTRQPQVLEIISTHR